MDVDTIISLINGCGFPIVGCGALFWFIVKQNEQMDNLTILLNDLKNQIENLSKILKKGDD